MSEPRPIEGATTVDRGWRSAAALFAVACFASVTSPAALLAIPFLLLVGAKGLRGFAMFAAIVLALLASVSGVTDAVWFVERGWALLLGGWFVALSLVWPASRPSTRALGAVFGAAGAAACLMAFRVGAWSALDWAITDRVKSAVAPMLEVVVWMRGERLWPQPWSLRCMMPLIPSCTCFRRLRVSPRWPLSAWCGGATFAWPAVGDGRRVLRTL